jgi:hypothetical protein
MLIGRVPFGQAASVLGEAGPDVTGEDGREAGRKTDLPDTATACFSQKNCHVPSVGSCPTPGLEKSHTPFGKIFLSRAAWADVNATL